jgi:hypothetical protein
MAERRPSALLSKGVIPAGSLSILRGNALSQSHLGGQMTL